MRVEVIGDATLYLGDCSDVLPLIGRVDAVVTDPPYGIGESAAKNRTRGKLAKPTDYGIDEWDEEPCPVEIINWMLSNTRLQIIFGGNFFPLPPTSCWLIWDKENSGDFADAEMAWTNLKKAVRLKRWMWNGMLRKGLEERFHLTQKPLQVMEWCLSHLDLTQGSTVIDPFMGSGTTGVACIKYGIKFIGIEREQHHFDMACKRISEVYSQPTLFKPAPVKVPVKATSQGIFSDEAISQTHADALRPHRPNPACAWAVQPVDERAGLHHLPEADR